MLSENDDLLKNMEHVVVVLKGDYSMEEWLTDYNGIAASQRFSNPKVIDDLELLRKINKAIIQDAGEVSNQTATLLTGNEYSDPALHNYLEEVSRLGIRVSIIEDRFAIQIWDGNENLIDY